MAFIKVIKDYIKNNYNLSHDYLTVIFPNKRAAYMLRKELMSDNDKNIWLPQMLSIQEAMSMWSGLQLIDNLDATFELMKIMNNNSEFVSNYNHFSLASQIVKDFDEIDQYAVDAENLFSYIKEIKEAENWNPDKDKTETEKAYLNFFKSLYTYYNSLREVLLKDDCGYYGLITRKLYDLSKEELDNVIGDKKIIFAGFNAMTLTEENIIVRLVESKKAALLWDLDKYYLEDEKQEAGLFARQFFKKYNNLKPESFSDKLLTDDKIINIVGVSGSTVQSNALQINLIKEKEDKSNKAVVLSDESLLIPVLNSIPNSYDKLQVTMGYPFSNTILYQFINHIFAFKNGSNKDEEVYFWNLKRLLETEFIKNIFDSNDLFELSRFINHNLKNTIYNLTINDIEEYFNDNENLRKFLSLICKKWGSTQEYINSIKELLLNINNLIPNGEDRYFLKNQISIAGRIINKIEKLYNKYNLILQIHDIEMLFKQASNEMSIKLDGQNDGLQIMGLLETRNLDFDVVHILSVNEGILPQSKSTNSLIPFDLRKHYKLPIYTNKQAVYAYHFYRLLQNAKIVNIYYNILADGMGEGEPSRFILQLQHELQQKNRNIKINNILYKNPDVNLTPINNLEVQKTDNILAKIKTKLSGTNSLGNKTGLSPTSLSCYLNCSLKFYLKYIENVQDNSTDELIQSNVIGSIIHSFFELLYKEFDDSIITYETYNAKVTEEKKNELFQQALVNNNFKKGLPETGFNYLNKIMIEELIENFINCEKEFLSKGNTLKIIGLEKNLTHTFKIENVDVNLIGFADRIDKTDGKIRILDYKTGKINEDDVVIKDKYENISDLPEKSLQLLIYKYLYAKSHNIGTDNIEPGIFGLLKINNIYFPLKNYSDTFNDENLIQNCDTFFEAVFRELLNPEIPFVQTTDDTKCKYCDFITICKRKKKSW
ncbi:MAG: PD-(D/E)XK nuclease family protein [Bacteroidales bacterium]|nr:PD-(D/E)XK nuclease family protein [Bacteroidales bacterium]